MRKRLGMILAFGLAVSIASAQLGQDGVYRLQPDDLVRILMRDDNQVNADIPIGPDGNISAPFVGTLKAQGKSTAELEAELVALYKDRLKLRNPRISVTIIKYRAVRASVGGNVYRPGVYEMRPGDTLVTLLSQANGFVKDVSDARRATFRRTNSRELIPVDLVALLSGDTSQNYIVNDGDELIVPERKRSYITVLGTIAQPGQYPYQEDMSLMDAIGVARGEVKSRSVLSKTRVVRRLPDGRIVQIPCNLIKYGSGDFAQNIILQPGDMVYVPENKTPDLATFSSFVNTLYFFSQVSSNGILGLKFK